MAGVVRVQITLMGGGPWGFRLQGGPGTGSPLTVFKIRRKSKAYNNLREGDRIVSANGIPCDHLTYNQVMAIADKAGSEFNLEIERKEEKMENHSSVSTVKTDENSIICSESATKSNKLLKVMETETMVTETTSDVTTKKLSSIQTDIPLNETANLTEFPTQLPSVKISESEPNYENKTKVSRNRKNTFDNLYEARIKTSTESIHTGEKYEKLEEEKFCEKDENKDITILRIDNEECLKSKTASSSLPIISERDLTVTHANQSIEQPRETPQKESVTSETYEIHKTEKIETQTNKIVIFPPTTTTMIHGSTLEDTGIFHNNSQNDVIELHSVDPVSAINSSTETGGKCESITAAKKKKMFSSSSFYEEPHSIYPTVQEQFQMAKNIAESLVHDHNKKSKGADMFSRRAKKSTKWIHEGPEPLPESARSAPEILPKYPPSALATDGRDVSKSPFPKLKLVLDPRQPVDLKSLKSTGHIISEHNVISPEVCHELVRDLKSPKGKGSTMFANRMKKSSEWIVDEENVKALMAEHERNLIQMKQNVARSEALSWCPPPHSRVDPERLAETVIAAADLKRSDSLQMIEKSTLETCRFPPTPAASAALHYDIYKPRAPKGWSAISASADSYEPPVAESISTYKQRAIDAEPFPSFASLTTSLNEKRFNFQNFNTLPRTWKAKNF